MFGLDWELMLSNVPLLMNGLAITVVLSFIGMPLAIVMACVLVAAQRSGIRVLVVLTRIYTEVILGIPVLVLLFLIFFVLPVFGIVLGNIQHRRRPGVRSGYRYIECRSDRGRTVRKSRRYQRRCCRLLPSLAVLGP